MSGNPFRRPQAPSRMPDESSHCDERQMTKPLPMSKTKKKRVVIQTPPHSPEEPSIPRRISDGVTASPPPPLVRRDEDEETDSAASSDLEPAQINTRRNSGPLQAPVTTFAIQIGARSPAGSSNLPYNPFARTLATSEAEYGLQNKSEQKDTINGNGARHSAGRPALDVDAFKNILLTGSAAPSAAVVQQQSSWGKTQDHSNTQPSAGPRHPAFDQMQEAYPESPRTSFSDYARNSDASDDDATDEDSSLMGPVESRPVEEGPPPPPKQARAYPQTVSFANFDNSLNAATLPGTPAHDTHYLHGNAKHSLSRSPSDLNKPLPPPPAVPTGASQPAEQVPTATGFTTQDQANENEPSRLKKPPPPPASRRPGQSTPAQNNGRARSTSNVSQSSSQYGDRPPPPPSRRPQSVHSGASSPAVDLPPSLLQTSQTANGSRTQPPPPPRRMTSKPGTSSIRTPSTASRHSLKRDDPSNTLPTGGVVPPAPPPRRGGQKRNSVEGPPNSLAMRRMSGADMRRPSGQSFDSDRSVSLSSLKQVAEPVGEEEDSSMPPAGSTTGRDILADLSAFQAEIDALRAQRAS